MKYMSAKEKIRQSIGEITDDDFNRKKLWKLFRPRHNGQLITGSVITGFVLFIAVFPALFTGYDPVSQNMQALSLPPSTDHLFGTDNFGRDVFARVIYGARIDLKIGFLATLIPFVFGSTVGLVAAYYGKWIDSFLTRFIDIMTAFPFIILVIAIVSIMGSGVSNLYLAIWLVGWREYARLVRSKVLTEKKSDYILAARLLGYSDIRIMFRHILPNVLGDAAVYAVSDVMMCMLVGASLSFLGLGVQPPIPEWGAIISEGRAYISYAWWTSTFPGIALAVTGTGLSLFGSGIGNLISGDGR
jgi:peptide/nickel transport system permease protein